MKNNLTTTNQNAKLALSKSKSLLNITNSLLSKKANSDLEKRFKFKPFLIERGHFDSISSITITPNGKYVVSASLDDTIKIWDIESKECLKTIKSNEETIDILKVTPDGKYIVAVSVHNNIIKIWDFKNGELLNKINVSTYSIDITPDSKHIITGSSSKDIKIWDLKSGECLKTLKGHSKTISSVLISSSGKYLISTDISNMIKIWSAENTTCLRTIKVYDEDITSIIISKDDNKILAVCNNHIIKIWDLKSGKFLKRIDKINPKNLMRVSSDWKKIITINSENTIELWDLESGKFLKNIDNANSRKSKITIIPDMEKVIINRDNTIEIWDLENINCLSVFNYRKRKDIIHNVKISSDKQIIAIETFPDYIVEVWNIKNGEFINAFGDGESILEISSSGENITTLEYYGDCVFDRAVRIYDTKSGECLYILENGEYNHQEEENDDEESVQYTDSQVEVYDTKTRECILTIVPEYGIAIDKNGCFIVTGDDCIDNYIRISEDSFNQRKLTKDEKNYFCKIKNKEVSPNFNEKDNNKSKIPEIDIDEDEIPF
jgi:WD40 repeat protein